MPKKSENVIINKNKKGDNMSRKKNTQTENNKKGFSKYSYKKKSDHPKLENIDYGVTLPAAKGFLYNIVEIPKGVSFCVTYEKGKEDFQINFKDGEDKNNSEFFLTLDANINARGMSLYKPFRDLSLILGYRQVDFTVFLEYVSYESQKCKYLEKGDDTVLIIITDIYINSNWIRQKDLEEICRSCGLFTMPILYEGVYNENLINSYTNDVYSHFNKKEKLYGVMVKATIEDEKDSKRLASIRLNNRFIPILPKQTQKDIMSKEVVDYIKRSFGEEKIESIDKKVKAQFPGFLENTKDYTIKEILEYSVKEAKTNYLYNLYLMKSFNNNTKKVMKKELNKQLSDLFIRRYDMFKKESV